MNSLEDAIGFVVDLFFEKDENGTLHVDELLAGPFRSFALMEKSERSMKNAIVAKMTERLRQDVVVGAMERKSRQFRMTEKLHLEEAKWITPASSNELGDVNALRETLIRIHCCA